MSWIESEVKSFKKYCEPYGRKFNTGISIINSGYTGDVVYNTNIRSYSDFWRLLQENTDKLLKEIDFIVQQIMSKETLKDEADYIAKKLKERKAIQRAAAQYVEMYGILGDAKDIRNHLYKLKDLTYQVLWNSAEPEEFIAEYDSEETLFYISPSIQIDVLSDEFIDMLRNIKGCWILKYFYSKQLLERYKEFNIKFSYSENGIQPSLDVTITNFN